MESVKSIVKDVVYGKSKIHTNMEFTFSNNKDKNNGQPPIDNRPVTRYNVFNLIRK